MRTAKAIEDVRTKKHELEQALQREVAELVTEFNKETGIAITSIYVELLDVSHMDGARETLVGEVDVDVSL